MLSCKNVLLMLLLATDMNQNFVEKFWDACLILTLCGEHNCHVWFDAHSLTLNIRTVNVVQYSVN